MAHPPRTGAEDVPEGFRQRHRRQRRREFLDTALGIITSEGLAALTMQRVTDELGSSVGSIYHYFGSKGALIAELQREALDVLARSLLASQANLERVLADEAADERVVALARTVAAARFWIAAELHFPLEIELLRRQFTTPEELLGDDEVGPVLEAGLSLLALCRRLLDDSVDTGALRGGPNIDRALLLIAGATGVLLTSGLSRWDAELFDGQRLARMMLADLLAAWGADAAELGRVDEMIETLVAREELVPVVGPAEPAEEETRPIG